MTRNTSFSYFSLFSSICVQAMQEVPSSVLCYKSFKCIISLIINIEHALLEHDHFDSIFSICINRTTLHLKFQKSQQRLQLNKNQNTHTQGLACCQLHATRAKVGYIHASRPLAFTSRKYQNVKKLQSFFQTRTLLTVKTIIPQKRTSLKLKLEKQVIFPAVFVTKIRL